MKCARKATNQLMRKGVYHTVSHIAVSEVMLTWDFNGAMMIYSGRSLIR